LTRLLDIRLTQFRSYGSAAFAFPERISCITGPNGSGKTALLDAVYYLCYTKSYFSAQQLQTVQFGTDGFRVEGRFERRDDTELITCIWRGGKKELSADGASYDKVSDHIGRYTAVMIAPDDMVLINGGSEGRRRWLDSILGQTDREYLERLLIYQRVLQQRNAWLKLQASRPSPDRTELEFYNAQLSETGTYIHARRRAFVNDFVPRLQALYEQLSGARELVSLGYETALDDAHLAALLEQSFVQDLRLQRTNRGIHRDELSFGIRDLNLRLYGSQGQKKSFLFAMKLAQYQYITRELGHTPMLLLDDIFEKLDQRRMEALLSIIQAPDFGQVLLTDTHAERVREAFGTEASINEIRLD
jgi:DNA replication and repair protein RecF